MIRDDQIDGVWAALASLGVAAWDLALDGTIRRANDHALQPLSETPGGRAALTDQIAAVDREAVAAGFADLVTGRQDHVVLACSLSSQLDSMHAVAHGTCLMDQDGNPSGVLVISSDVTTEHRRAQRWNRLAQHVADLVVVLGPDGEVLHHNDRAEDVLAISSLEAEGFMDRIHPDDRDDVADVLRELMTASGTSTRFDARITGDDGVIRTIESTAVNGTDEVAVGGIIIAARDVTAQRTAEAEVRWAAQHDPVTDLPNWRWLSTRLTDRLSEEATDPGPALIVVSVAGLVSFIASLGQTATEWLMQGVAERIREVVPSRDLLGHLGREVFVVVSEVRGEQDALNLAHRIANAFDTALILSGRTVHVGVSVGIATSAVGDDPDTLLRRAEAAMIDARAAGGNRVVAAAPDAHDRAARQLDLEVALRAAVRADQIEVHLQPQVDLADGTVHGFEALARWTHPHLGPISPMEFIAIAERSELIQQLGRNVLERACRLHAEILAAAVPHAILSVNVSARQLMAPDFVSIVRNVLSTSGMPARQLCLEITESALLDDVSQAATTLGTLRGDGIRIAVDDFGTGHSSLAQLKRFAIDYVKIDRAFVAGLGTSHYDSELIRVVVSMSQAMGIEVVAEGVEQLQQITALQDLGCHISQGYYWGAPVPADHIPQLLDRLGHLTDEVRDPGDRPAAPDHASQPASAREHELREMLTVIALASSRLRLAREPERAEQALLTIERATQTAQELMLINTRHAVAASGERGVQSGRPARDPLTAGGQIDLGILVSDVVAEFRPLLNGSQVVLRIPDTGPVVQGSSNWLREALVHVLADLGQRAQDGADVEVGVDEAHGMAQVRVRARGLSAPAPSTSRPATMTGRSRVQAAEVALDLLEGRLGISEKDGITTYLLAVPLAGAITMKALGLDDED